MNINMIKKVKKVLIRIVGFSLLPLKKDLKKEKNACR